MYKAASDAVDANVTSTPSGFHPAAENIVKYDQTVNS